MRIYILVTLMFLAGVCTAQKKRNVYFLKNDGRYVPTRDSANYLRVVEEPDSGSQLYNVFEYYLSGKKKSAGQSARMDPVLYEGQFVAFDSSGIKKKVTTYKDNVPVGDEFLFYPNGKTYMVYKYPEAAIAGSSFTNKVIVACYDSTGTALAEDGNGALKIYDDSFKTIVETGIVKAGKRDGKCEGVDLSAGRHFIEEYKDGELVSGIATDSAGKDSYYTKGRYIEPGYPGGSAAFYKYLRRKIHYPAVDKENNISGTVVLSFVVEKDGRLTDIKILNHVSPNIDAEAVRVMRESPSWLPGIVYGRQVRVRYAIPIGFSLR